MANNKSYLFAALALLLTGERLAKAEVYVCGTDYADAETNCVVNTACPAGDGCSTDQTCFALPEESCVDSTATTVSPAPTVTPADLYVCGISLEDALTKCRSEVDYCTDVTNTSAYCALTGDSVTRSCFIIAYEDCYTTDNEMMSMSLNMSMNVSLNSTSATSVPTASATPVPSMSTVPSNAPIYNQFFCGIDYQTAESDCFKAEACPSGSCSKPGEQCFGISAERCISRAPTSPPTVAGPQPSANPTLTSLPSMFPSTIVPTAVVVNTMFCGADYDDATLSCSETGRACPTGSGCPPGLMCYAGITCVPPLPPSSAAPTLLTAGAGTATALSTSPVTTSPVTTSSAAPIILTVGTGSTSTISPTTLFDKLIGEGNTTPPPVPLIQRYCALSLDDANNFCAVKMPCHDGSSLVCSLEAGESCFEIEGQCNGGAPTVTVTLQPAAAPVAPFDPDNTFYCGTDYDDAVMNCYNTTACPQGGQDECPMGMTCYPIVTCQTPPPVPSPISADGMGIATSAPTSPPIYEIDLEQFVNGNNSGYTMLKVLLTKSLLLFVAVLLY